MKIFNVILVFLCFGVIVGCSSGNAAIKSELLGIYEQFRVASLSGDLKQYRALRDPVEMKKFEEKVGNLTGEHISYGAEIFPLTNNLRSIEIVKKGAWAQLLASAGEAVPDAGGERAKFLIVLFHKTNLNWRVVRLGMISGRKNKDGGQLNTVVDITVPERLRIPSNGT
jgi:hypothetical protein